MKAGPLAPVAALIGLLLVPGIAAAQVAPGTYRCSSYNVSGGGGSCRTMPPLVLHPDGTYQFSSTTGNWTVRGDKLLLSESKLWGPGAIVGQDTIRFEYEYRGWQHVVTWICQGCASANAATAAARSGHAPAAGSLVGISLTLEFDTSVGGVSGFTIVPAEAARAYGHNAPLPQGAVQGLAWETSRTAVALTTNRNNRLMSGRRYVVFLVWPRDALPVAILDLPAASEDYTGKLQATLDGASVLARLASQAAAPATGAPRQPAAGPPSAAPDSAVVGNQKSKVYHWVGCPDYDNVSAGHRVPFASREAAEQAGYRAAKNCP